MPNSTPRAAARKPSGRIRSKRKALMGLPPEFPLFPHKSGRWAKKVKGRRHYFGKVADDPKGEAALRKWLDQKDDLLAGRAPRAKGDEGELTLRTLCNAYLTSKLLHLKAGTLSERTFCEYTRATDQLIDTFGKDRLAADLRPDDFQKLYAKLAAKHGMTTLGREITMVRSVFKFGTNPENGLRLAPVMFGSTFKAPSKKARRIDKAKSRRERGYRMFEADEIRRMIDAAGPQLKAMILLGINAGFGNTDCAALPKSAVNLKTGWVDFPRPKTGNERRIPLWPETVEALKAALDCRPKPRDEGDANLVFLTRLGQPWVRFDMTETADENGRVQVTGKGADAVATATAKLLKELGIYRRGVTFYALRHTFETIAGGSRDQVAVDAMMGHVDGSMAAEYRELIHNDGQRLRAVVDSVHAWLYATEAAADSAQPQQPSKPAKAKRQRQPAARAAKRQQHSGPTAEAPRLRIVG